MTKIHLSLIAAALLTACGGSSASSTPATQASAGSEQAPRDIVDTAVAAGSFNTLAAALQAAGLVDTLKSAGPFTVFAPTDAAFAELPAGTVDNLLLPENREQLRAILSYHVVPGRVMASEVVSMSSATSVQGSNIAIAVVDGNVMLNGNSKVTATDVAASNGVIHVIDHVIMPPAN